MRFQIMSTLLFAASALASRQCHEVPDTTTTVPSVPTTPTTPTEPTTPTVPTTVPTTPTNPGNGGKDVTVIQADNACGNDLELHCCEDEQSFEGLGLLSSLLVGGAGLFNGCSKLSIAGLIGVGDLLGSHCKQTAVCCHGGETTQNGLINVAIPCIAIGGLL